MALVGYGTLPNARVIGDALGDTSSSHDIGLTIAIVALVVSQTAPRTAAELPSSSLTEHASRVACWQVAEIGNELIRTMERALLADVVTAADLPEGNAYFSFNVRNG